MIFILYLHEEGIDVEVCPEAPQIARTSVAGEVRIR